ncbi:hypothetical protein [Galbibacter orientalis]|uniref:hypothetical protein n=1 Tax=Galbibacter orientalis TaxID=453852 RepID=UPI003080DB1C
MKAINKIFIVIGLMCSLSIFSQSPNEKDFKKNRMLNQHLISSQQNNSSSSVALAYNVNSVNIQQVGHYNSIKVNYVSKNSSSELTQYGNSNKITQYKNSQTLNEKIYQKGTNNEVFEISNRPMESSNSQVVQKGTNLRVEKYGTNSIGANMKINMDGTNRTVIIRNF